MNTLPQVDMGFFEALYTCSAGRNWTVEMEAPDREQTTEGTVIFKNEVGEIQMTMPLPLYLKWGSF